MDDHPATDLEAAWSELHEAMPFRCFVARPAFRHDLDNWEQYAFDTNEKAMKGKRSREWTAVAPTEVEAVLEMARCMRELAAGGWPR